MHPYFFLFQEERNLFVTYLLSLWHHFQISDLSTWQCHQNASLILQSAIQYKKCHILLTKVLFIGKKFGIILLRTPFDYTTEELPAYTTEELPAYLAVWTLYSVAI